MTGEMHARTTELRGTPGGRRAAALLACVLVALTLSLALTTGALAAGSKSLSTQEVLQRLLETTRRKSHQSGTGTTGSTTTGTVGTATTSVPRTRNGTGTSGRGTTPRPGTASGTGTASGPGTTSGAGTSVGGRGARGTTAGGAATSPGGTSRPGAGATTSGSPSVTSALNALEHPRRTQAAPRAGKSSRLSGGALALAVIAGLLALMALVWAVFRFAVLEPHWLLSLRHALAEAGFRASAVWAELLDWARLGH